MYILTNIQSTISSLVNVDQCKCPHNHHWKWAQYCMNLERPLTSSQTFTPTISSSYLCSGLIRLHFLITVEMESVYSGTFKHIFESSMIYTLLYHPFLFMNSISLLIYTMCYLNLHIFICFSLLPVYRLTLMKCDLPAFLFINHIYKSPLRTFCLAKFMCSLVLILYKIYSLKFYIYVPGSLLIFVQSMVSLWDHFMPTHIQLLEKIKFLPWIILKLLFNTTHHILWVYF